MRQMTKIFNYPQEVEQVSTKVKRETGKYVKFEYTMQRPPAVFHAASVSIYIISIHSLNNNIIDSNTTANKKQGNQLVQGLKEVTQSKSSYDFGTKFSANST